MADDQGASPRELVLEACRRNNTDLLEEVIGDIRKASKNNEAEATKRVAAMLNQATDAIGNGVLHVAAQFGSYDVLDTLLDQEGLEIDNVDRMERDTALHKAVRHVNELGKDHWAAGHAIVDILLDAGCDPRKRNKAKLRPLELADPRNKELRSLLQNAEYAMQVGGDVVVEDDDDGPTGSASDSG